MEVVLLEDVKSLGKKGEIVKVNDGYARNFILPKKLGVEANAKNLNDLKLQQAHADKVAAEQLAAAKEQCGKPFPDEERLLELQKKKVQLDLALEFKEDGEDVMAAEENGDGSGQGERKEPPTLEQRIYRKFRLFAAPVLDGEAYYMKLQAKGYEDLVVEAVGGEEYSIAHYYDQNGDSMRDPEITFTIDRENKSIYPASFLQDGTGVYYETADASPATVRDLKGFMVQWFTNIKNQKFEPVKIKRYEQEEENGMER